jgi:hypothetical protein
MKLHSDAMTWAWRAAVIACGLWIGYELHQVNRSMPEDVSYTTEEQIRGIAHDLEGAKRQLEYIERNTRR